MTAVGQALRLLVWCRYLAGIKPALQEESGCQGGRLLGRLRHDIFSWLAKPTGVAP